MSQGLINGGYMVINKKIFKYIKKSNIDFEHSTINNLCKQNEVMAYRNNKFWYCMDNEREYKHLKDIFRQKANVKSFFNL